MEKFLIYKNKKIYYSFFGNGFPLVFLHGFLESKEIWTNFVLEFQNNYSIVLIDLPGHGKSETISETQKMAGAAEVVNFVLQYLNINKFIMIGHSMGGYITLEFEKKYSEKLVSFVLFHSSAANDNSQKIINRKREIDLIKQNKKMLICNTNIPLMFAEENRIKFSDDIEFSKNICKNIPDNGIIAFLNGMMVRKNNFDLLRNIKKEIFYIIGEKDNLIPLDSLIEQVKLNNKIKYEVLKNSGHMGFVEEKELSKNKLLKFINDVIKKNKINEK